VVWKVVTLRLGLGILLGLGVTIMVRVINIKLLVLQFIHFIHFYLLDGATSDFPPHLANFLGGGISHRTSNFLVSWVVAFPTALTPCIQYSDHGHSEVGYFRFSFYDKSSIFAHWFILISCLTRTT